MLESLYRRNTVQDVVRGILTDLVVDGGAVSASASGAAHSSMRSAVTPAATRAPAAVPLMRGSLKPLSRALERGYSARWAFGTRQPSFLYTETGLLDCDPMPSMDMWRVRRRRPRLRRPAKVVLPPLIAPVRDEDRCIKTLSAHVLPRVESASCRRRSSVRRPTFSISRERTAVKKGAYRFPTHALYQGDWHNTLRIFEGQGVYLGPHKVEYEGDFQDGMCHGAGALHYPNAAVIHGTWERGHLIQPMYISKDGLSFEPNGDYCRMPDRRYFTEVQKGLRPAGRSQLTNQHPPRRVPPGCYDAGDGIFDPRRNAVYDPDTGDVVRVPTKSEMEWIKKHCRKGWDENVGYRPDLYENWFEEPKEELEKEGEEEEWIGEVESSLKMESSEEGKLSSEEMEEQEEQKPETDEAKKETGVPIHYPRILPPVAVQDVALDAAPPVNIFPRLFPETEGDVVPESTKDKLMIPIDTYIAPENMDVSGRYQAMLEDERRKQEKKEKRARERERRMAGETVEEGKKEEVESATSTPRLSLDDFDEIYKGPWRQMARRLVPLLRNRLEEDRKLAAAKWQEDLMQLLSERATHAGLEMSTSGYKGMAQPGPEEKRRTTPHSIIPPGLEERARQRRAERQERLRQEEEKRIQQQLERERRQAQAKAAVEKVASPDDERVEDEGDTPRRPPRRVSVLPSSAMAAPKGRESLAEGPMQPVSPQPVSPESPTSAAPPPKPHQRPRSSEGKKSLAFKDD